MRTASKKVRNVQDHKCRLPTEDDLVSLYIDGGILVDFRRNFRKLHLVSPLRPDAKAIFKSTAHLRREEAKHLKKYYYMIHPFSEARSMWETTMIVVYICSYFVIPWEVGTRFPSLTTYYINLAMSFMCLVDIGLSFFTGYYQDKTNKIILIPKKVFCHYVFGFFIFDFLSSIPFNFIMNTFNFEIDSAFKLVLFFKLFRLGSLASYITRFAVVSITLSFNHLYTARLQLFVIFFFRLTCFFGV